MWHTHALKQVEFSASIISYEVKIMSACMCKTMTDLYAYNLRGFSTFSAFIYYCNYIKSIVATCSPPLYNDHVVLISTGIMYKSKQLKYIHHVHSIVWVLALLVVVKKGCFLLQAYNYTEGVASLMGRARSVQYSMLCNFGELVTTTNRAKTQAMECMYIYILVIPSR